MDTQISLPPDLKDKIEREANRRGMSLSDFVCKSLEWAEQSTAMFHQQLRDELPITRYN